MTIQREANMTAYISEGIFSWLSLVGAAVPPRDPNDNDDEEGEETAATKTTTASRPLSENQTKISRAELAALLDPTRAYTRRSLKQQTG
jgi:hypothetical protein